MKYSSNFAAAILAVTASACESPASRAPAFVQELTERDFPADAKIHVLSRGQFDLRPDTKFCTFYLKNGFGVDGTDLVSAIRSHGQSELFNGSARTSEDADSRDRCKRKKSIFILGSISDDRTNHPYKLVLSVWQDQAVWVGKIERPGGEIPGLVQIQDEDGNPVGPAVMTQSMAVDARRLSRSFSQFFSQKR